MNEQSSPSTLGNTEPIVFDDPEDDEGVVNAAFSPMHFDTMQRKVRDLLSDYNSQELDPRPPFQRGFVWDKGRASRLVESILLNVPLPLIYTAEEEDGTEVVIDGQQRLLSVFGYINGIFPKDNTPFQLTGLKLLNDINGFSFAQLDKKQQKSIQSYLFQVIKISSESHPDVKFEIFERLNSGSVTLNAQELRNCVYRGRFNDVLKKLSSDSDFRAILGTSNISNRMQDAELVLRFLAFCEKTFLNYQPGMKSFLNHFMNEYRNISDEKTREFEKIFKKSISLSFSVFGPNAFRKYSVGKQANPNGGWEKAINRPLFDVLMWGFTRFEKNQVMAHADEIRDSLIDLLTSDSNFVDYITSATGDRTKTQERFRVWLNVLEGIITTKGQQRHFPYSVKKAMFDQNPVCGICGQAILSVHDAHVDHIKPVAYGGETVIDNAQLAHRYCNLRKGVGAA